MFNKPKFQTKKEEQKPNRGKKQNKLKKQEPLQYGA